MEPSLELSPVSIALLVITVGFSLAAFNNERLRGEMILEPYRMVRERRYHQLVTSGLIHGDMIHLMVNMMTLYFFGPTLEYITSGDDGSHVPFFAIYVVSLVVGSLYPFMKYRNRPDYLALGASGAITGLVFAFCIIAPTATLHVFYAIPMPAWLFGILFTAYSLFAMRRVNDNIGHEAHLAGGIAGIVTTILVAPQTVTLFRDVGIPFP